MICLSIAGCADPFGLRDPSSVDARLRGLGVSRIVTEPALPPPPTPLRLELADAVRLALDRHPSIQSARDGLLTARFGLESAWVPFNLGVRPGGSIGSVTSVGETAGQLEVGVAMTQQFFTGTKVTLNPSYSVATDGESQSALFGTSVTQPLLRGLSPAVVRSGIDAAESNLVSTVRRYRLTEARVVLDAVDGYYSVLRADRALAFQRASLQRVEGFARATEVRERIGLASAIDLYRAQLRLDRARDAVQAAEVATVDARDGLRRLLDLPPDHEILVDGPIRRLVWGIDPDDAIGIALDRRLELAQAAQGIEDARRGVIVAEDGLKPQVDFVISYSRLSSGDTFSDALGFEEDVLRIGLESSADFTPVAAQLGVEQAKLSLETTIRNARLLRIAIENEVVATLRRLARAEERIENQREQLRQSEGGLRLAQLKFERGLVSNFDMLEAETALLAAELGVIDAVVDQIGTVYELRRVMGTLIGPDGTDPIDPAALTTRGTTT